MSWCAPGVQSNLSKRPNSIRFSRALYLSNGGVPDRHHGFGTWTKAPEEALVLCFTPPQCDYWIFQLCNMWQENFDQLRGRPGLRHQVPLPAQARGSVWVVIADSDPGIGGNWVNPAGGVNGGGWSSLRLILTQRGAAAGVTTTCCPWQACARRVAPRSRGARKLVSGEVAD